MYLRLNFSYIRKTASLKYCREKDRQLQLTVRSVDVYSSELKLYFAHFLSELVNLIN